MNGENASDQAPQREPVRVGVAIVHSQQRILVGVRPAGTSLAGLHEFPGGKCRSNESTAVCAERECHEETGLTVRSVTRIETVAHAYDHADVVIDFWRCEIVENADSTLRPPFAWVPFEHCQQLDFPAANQSVLSKLPSLFAEEEIGD